MLGQRKFFRFPLGKEFMIKTYIPIEGSGYNFFLDSYGGFPQPIRVETLTTPMLLLSDKIIIDKSWRNIYYSLDMLNSVEYLVFNTLILNGLIDEFDPIDALNPNDYKDFFANALWEFSLSYAKTKNITLSDYIQELLLTKPREAIDLIKRSDSIIRPLTELGQYGLSNFFDSMLTSLIVGSISSRLHDPSNFLGAYFNNLAHLPDASVEKSFDWLVRICSEQMPAVPIFLSRNLKPAIIDHPLQSKGHGKHLNAYMKRSDIDSLQKLGFRQPPVATGEAADNVSTMMNLAQILMFRENNVIKDLRNMYSELLKNIEANKIDLSLLPDGKIFYKQWIMAKEELNKSISISKKFEMVTDIITLPSAIVSPFLPIVSAVPIITWAIAKISAKISKKDHLKKYPWFFIAEQMNTIQINMKAWPFLSS
jgi:hypothetical protein